MHASTLVFSGWNKYCQPRCAALIHQVLAFRTERLARGYSYGLTNPNGWVGWWNPKFRGTRHINLCTCVALINGKKELALRGRYTL